MRYISELIHEKRDMEKGQGSVFLKPGNESDGFDKVTSQGGSYSCCICKEGCKVNILALGDVGGTVLLGLKLLGGSLDGKTDIGVPGDNDMAAMPHEIIAQDCVGGRQYDKKPLISEIGIYDLNEKLLSRYEREINQICFPDGRVLPEVKILDESELFNCHMFVFCASKGVPPVGAEGDVRMAQLEANLQLVDLYARRAAREHFKGIFAVVSDPVDPLCKGALSAGLAETQVQGYGLGVMNARAAYFASRNPGFSMYLNEGRAFGPHGEDLVIANSIKNYDDGLSRSLTRLTVNSNMETRADGFKPYIAPAISSGAISLMETLKGSWNYSSLYFGKGADGAFLGCLNRRRDDGIEIEDRPLDDGLYSRIEHAYNNLKEL